MTPVSFTDRYGALIRGDVFAPLPGRAGPVHRRGAAPARSPGVVITTGLGAGLRADVLVAGAGPRRARLRRAHLRRAGPGHERDVPAPGRRSRTCPFCNPFAPPEAGEQSAARACRPAGVELRLRHRGRHRLLPLDAGPPYGNPGRAAPGRRLQPVLAAVRPLARPRTGHPRPDDAAGDRRPLARRRSPSPTCRASTRASRRSSRWTSSTSRHRQLRRSPRGR